jgi:hypothetical protein
MKMIIAGGRDYEFTIADVVWLHQIAIEHGPIEEVVTGGASGADAEGRRWAELKEIPAREFPPDWTTHGKAAGPIRNRQMARHVGPGGLCVLFPGGRGTASMKKEALSAGLTVIERGSPPPPPPRG